MRTIFLLVKTRRTNWQSSRPSVVTEKSSTMVTGCTDKVAHQSIYMSRQLSLLRQFISPQRLNRPMEGRIWWSNQPDQWKRKVMIHKYHVYSFPKGKQSTIHMTKLYWHGAKGGCR